MHIIRYNYPAVRSLAPAFGFAGRSPFADFETEIGGLVGAAFQESGLGGQFPVSVDEDKDNILVRAELPGVSRQDISLEIAEGVLTISAELRRKTGEKEESVSLSRSVSVPQDVQVEKAVATYENGVLAITLPKREQAKPHKIAIN
jgi:HSP20 family protein